MAVTIPKDHFPYFIVGICFESRLQEPIRGPFHETRGYPRTKGLWSLSYRMVEVGEAP